MPLKNIYKTNSQNFVHFEILGSHFLKRSPFSDYCISAMLHLWPHYVILSTPEKEVIKTYQNIALISNKN